MRGNEPNHMAGVFLRDRVLRCRPAPMRVTHLVSDSPGCDEDIGVKLWKEPVDAAYVNQLFTAVSTLVERPAFIGADRLHCALERGPSAGDRI